MSVEYCKERSPNGFCSVPGALQEIADRRRITHVAFVEYCKKSLIAPLAFAASVEYYKESLIGVESLMLRSLSIARNH